MPLRKTRRYKRLKRVLLLLLLVLLASMAVMSCLRSERLYGVDYDLVVVGSDPEGVAAAVSAARNGLNVLLLDRREELGGLLTRGWLNTLDMNYDPRGNLLTRGIFLEFFRRLEGISFDVNTARGVLEELVNQEENLQLLLGREVTAVRVKGRQVLALVLDDGQRLRAHRFIDATQDGEIAFLAGARFTLGMEDLSLKKSQAVTLILEVGGVNWEKVVKALTSPGQAASHEGAYGTTAWGFLEEMRAYTPLDAQIRSRGLNIGLQNNGHVLVNAMHIFGVDGLDAASRQKAMERGHREAEFLVRYMRRQLPGFEGAFLAATAPELYVRETRHLQGLYRLTIDDVLEHRDFWDKVALASYPVDIQATGMEDWGRVMGNPAIYSIPFRCLVPGELTNLLVAGRSASYDSLAFGSARVVPVGMVTGEAAGIAAALSLERKVNFHKMSAQRELIAALQQRIVEQGGYLRDFTVPYALQGDPLYPVVRELRSLGLVTGRYDNDYRLQEAVELRDISQVVEGYLRQVFRGRCQARHTSEERREARVEDLLWVLEGINGIDPEALGLEELLGDYNFYRGKPLLRGETFAFLLDFLQRI